MPSGRILDRRFFPKGSLVIEEGQMASCAYYIEEGAVEVFTADSDGREIHLSTLADEDIFGEMALISHGTRTASVRTLEDTTLVTMTPEDFRRSYSTSEPAFRKLLAALVERLVDANEFIAEQHKTIADFEDAASLTVKKVSMSIPEELQDKFVMEVFPVLDHLLVLLKKYKQMCPDTMQNLDDEIMRSMDE